MPVKSEGVVSTTYRSSLDIPIEVILQMKRDPRSNIILAKIEKYRSSESRGTRLQSDEFWIVCSTIRTTSRGDQSTIDFVLACTYGVVGKYPIFIYGTRLASDLSEEYVEDRVKSLIGELRRSPISPKRVYSIFAMKPVAAAFADHWTRATNIEVQEAYYDAKFSYCDARTLKQAPQVERNVIMRLAKESDIAGVASLCYGFAADSPPFTLSEEGSINEAKKMVRANQVWVLEVQSSHGSAIACIVCLTRSNDSVTAITKVYTPPNWRQRGYAFCLVRKVCDHLLNVEHKNYVVLYVGNDNPASKVYHRVGFAGLDRNSTPVELVEDWLELGFNRAKIELGHW